MSVTTDTERDFIICDYPRLSDSLDRERAEVKALQALVADMVQATVPNLDKLNASFLESDSWQARAQRVSAGLVLVKS